MTTHIKWRLGLVACLAASCAPADEGAPRAVDLGTTTQSLTHGHTALAVGSGVAHSCALLDNNQVKCWGANWTGELGLGDGVWRGDGPGEMGDSLPYVNVDTVRAVRAIAVGDEHTCALLDDGRVKCWGLDDYGQLGYDDVNPRGYQPGHMGDGLPTVNLGAGRSATAVTAGASHSCALLDTGQVKCWGKGVYGALGQGNPDNQGGQPGQMAALAPINLGTGRTAKAISAGWGHTCAILDNNQLKCWGANGYGQLGLGDQVLRGNQQNQMGDALPAVNLGTGRTAKLVVAGDAHTCAVLDNNTLKCWGLNDYGELGLGDKVTRGWAANQMGDALPAVSLGTSRTAKLVSLGERSTCAVLDNNTVKCWGNAQYGQLGLGSTVQRGDDPGEMGNALAAVSLGTSRTAVQIDAGFFDVCAVLDNGSVKCWGDNGTGALGLGDTAARGDEASEMGNTLPAVALGTGQLSSKFLKSDPRVIRIMQGTPYNQNDPGFIVPPTSDLNKDSFAYKIFAALHLLGYETNMGWSIDQNQHLRVLHFFQQRYGFPQEDWVRANVVAKIDDLLVPRESSFASNAQPFPLRAHMQPPARNDISTDAIATLYSLPFQVIPSRFRMAEYESVQCVYTQCLGGIQDAAGNDWPTFPVDITQDYRFTAAHHNARLPMPDLKSAAVEIATVLHEFAHYVDGHIYAPDPMRPTRGILATRTFSNIAFVVPTTGDYSCLPRRSNNLADFVSNYGFSSVYGCTAGSNTYVADEEFAEAFAMYVAAGRNFRAKAAASAMLLAQYNWLRANVFANVEYDTGLLRAFAPDDPTTESYVWDGTLPRLP